MHAAAYIDAAKPLLALELTSSLDALILELALAAMAAEQSFLDGAPIGVALRDPRRVDRRRDLAVERGEFAGQSLELDGEAARLLVGASAALDGGGTALLGVGGGPAGVVRQHTKGNRREH